MLSQFTGKKLNKGSTHQTHTTDKTQADHQELPADDQNITGDLCSIHNPHSNPNQQGSKSTFDTADAAELTASTCQDHPSNPSNPLTALTMVLNERGIHYQLSDQTQTYPPQESVQISHNNKTYTFTDDNIPSDACTQTDLFNNPEHRYQLFNQQVQMPKTMGFMCPSEASYPAQDDNHLPSLISIIEKFFSYPVLIKIHLTKSKDHIKTFFCEDQDAIALPLRWVTQHGISDATLVTEAYISPRKNYQVFCYDHNVILAYEWQKSLSNHPEMPANSGAIQTQNLTKLRQLQNLAQPLLRYLESVFAQLEFIEDKHGDLYLTDVKINPSIKNFFSSQVHKSHSNKSDANNSLLMLYRCVLDRLLTTPVKI